MNHRLTQKEIAEELGCSTSSLHCYRKDINMLSPYRIPANTKQQKKTKDFKL